MLDSNHQTLEATLTGETTDDEQFLGVDQLDAFFAGKALRNLLDELAAEGVI